MAAFFALMLLAVLALSAVSAGAAGVGKNTEAVQHVHAAKRPVANAAWWGFDEEDSTDALQAAIEPGAKKVIVPNAGKDWIARPIRLAGSQELVLQRGVVMVARRGEFRGSDIANLQYPKAEWRTDLPPGVVLALRVNGAEGRPGLTGGQDNSGRIAQC